MLTVLALHGHDDDPAALASLLERWFESAGFDDVAVLAPAGPVATEHGRAWWSDDADDNDDVAVAALLAGLGDAVRRAQRSGPVAVLGYSQGGALALLFALSRPAGGEHPPVGLGVVAGFLPALLTPPIDASHLARTAVLVAHGTDDDVVPVQAGRSAARLLARAGLDVALAERETGHDLHAFRDDVTAWVAALPRR